MYLFLSNFIEIAVNYIQRVKTLIRSYAFCSIKARGYKTFFMLNSVEHKIFIAHKYENIKKFSIFQAQIGVECYFSCSQMLKCQQLLAF